jgi:hypothetical protein
MIYKRLLIAVIMALAACETRPSTSPTAAIPETPLPEGSPTASAVLNAVTNAISTEEPTALWLETEMNGVTLGLWQPINWETDTSDGLVLAEHTVSSNEPAEEGILVHCFVPSTDEYRNPDPNENYAWQFLDWVVKMPNHTGWDVTMSQPEGFEWDEHEAAYYLMTTGDGVRGIVLAVAVPEEHQIVACNISAVVAQAHRIRAALPELLNGLMIDGYTLNSTGLAVLPDPFQFPRYHLGSDDGNKRFVNPPSH